MLVSHATNDSIQWLKTQHETQFWSGSPLSRNSQKMSNVGFIYVGRGTVASADIWQDFYQYHYCIIVCHCCMYSTRSNSRKNGTTASIRLHGHDTLVEKYNAVALVWTEVNWQIWINNNIDDWQTSNIVLPLPHSKCIIQPLLLPTVLQLLTHKN